MSVGMLIRNINYIKTIAELSVIGFGKRIGVNRSTVGAWLEGRAMPTTKHLEKISNATRISIDDLVRKDISKITPAKRAAKWRQIQKLLTT